MVEAVVVVGMAASAVVATAVARCVAMVTLVHLVGVDYVKAINTNFFYSVYVVGKR